MKWDRTQGRPEPVAALDRVIERDNGEPLVDLRVLCPEIALPRDTTIPYLRERVAKMLSEAARHLPDGLFIAATDCWRPYERQVRIYEFMTQKAAEAYPERVGPSLTRTVNRWVAPPGRKAPPGHCTGAAVDVILIDQLGEQVDVTSPYGRFEAGPTFVHGLSETAKHNRMALFEAMILAGFSNCRDEWWHYSYGDAGWAVRQGLSECVYGLAKLDPELYRDEESRHIEALQNRPNPFIEG